MSYCVHHVNISTMHYVPHLRIVVSLSIHSSTWSQITPLNIACLATLVLCDPDLKSNITQFCIAAEMWQLTSRANSRQEVILKYCNRSTLLKECNERLVLAILVD